MRTRASALLVIASFFMLALGGTASAQAPWDSPSLRPPSDPGGLGLHLLDPGSGDLGFLMTYRSQGSFDYRLGLVDGPGPDTLTLLGGVEFAGRLSRAAGDNPFDIDWWAGVGAGLGDFTLVSVPFGLTFGHSFSGDGATFIPWFGPKIVLDAFFGDEIVGDETDIDLGVDLGIDLHFTQGWFLRLGASVGDRDAVALGVVF